MHSFPMEFKAQREPELENLTVMSTCDEASSFSSRVFPNEILKNSTEFILKSCRKWYSIFTSMALLFSNGTDKG